MTLPYPINPTQTDARSPVDDNLMDSIRLDLDYLDTLLIGGATLVNWNVNGPLDAVRSFKRAIDTAGVMNAFTPGVVRWAIKHGGTGGILQFDIRKHTRPNTPIVGIAYQYEGLTQSIANVAPALSTQSISRATAQINTQSITLVKAAINIESIIQVGIGLWRMNLASAPDSDWSTGDPITVAGATAGGNNGNFTVHEVNQSGHPSIVVSNLSGAAQLTSAGTVQLNLWSFNFTNPVSSQFAPGEFFIAAGHSNGANDGNRAIYKVNQGGNNIWTKLTGLVAQGSAAGTVDTSRWAYTFGSPVSTSDFTIGERAKMASHSNAANNGNFSIRGVNVGGNNIIVENVLGVAQAGAAGNANTNRWIYALSTDPSGQVVSGDRLRQASHSSSANDGTFAVKEVNRGGTNNLVVYNESGVSQGGVAGNTRTTRKLVKFASDQSAIFSTGSFVDIYGTPDTQYNSSEGLALWEVLEVNRGGGANYNIVIDSEFGGPVPSPAGFIALEAKSILNNPITVNPALTGLAENQFQNGSTTDVVPNSVSANTPLGLYVTSVPLGEPKDLSVWLS